MTLFVSTPLDNNAHHKIAKIHYGAYNCWTGAIIHVAGTRRVDLCYSVVKLSGYNALLVMVTFDTLRHFLCFLYYHPYVPIMYKRCSCDDKGLKWYIVKRYAVILDTDIYQGLKVYTDADLSRDLGSRCSLSSVIIEINGTDVGWGSYKQ